LKWQRNAVRKEIINDQHRFKVIVAGRRWGKTHLAIMWLLSPQVTENETRWYIAPTYRQGKMIAWPVLRQLFRHHTEAKINESELSVTLTNGATIFIKGADNEDSLRGAGINKVILDEYAYFKPHVWEEIILPMLATSQGQAMFIGTPSGYNAMYDLYMKGQSDPDWKSWKFKTIEGGFVEEDEIKRIKSNMDGRLYRQEMESSFETTGNRAAYNFDRDIHVKKAQDIAINKWIGMDMNVDYMTAVIACEYTDGTIHYFDEIRQSNSNTESMAKAMRKKWPEVLMIYPDPAGSARSTTSHRSDHTILRDYGYTVRAKKAHPSHIDRLNALNRKLVDANGSIGMTVDPKCKYLIKDLEQVQRDKRGGIDKTSDITLTHAIDACSYVISYKWSINRNIATSQVW
tara:strand:+ start:111 stop:1316 length:1206 start_codon:yes stop_codon:yes gene_type:complete